jgi:tetratricopeptide (TPR) repeat protein
MQLLCWVRNVHFLVPQNIILNKKHIQMTIFVMKSRYLLKQLIVVSLLLFSMFTSNCFSQTSSKYDSKYENFYRAEELFDKMQFAAARIEFRNFLNACKETNDPYYIKALYYEGVSALELFNNDAIDLLESFNRNYPESIYKHLIYFRIGKYYYQKKDYKTSLIWFNQLTKFNIQKADYDEYFFKMAYANFELGNFKEARSGFYEVKDGNSSYAPASLYYFSHIAYQDGSYQSALEGFEKLVKNPSFKQIAQNYIIQIYYRLGSYEDVIAKGPEYLDSASGNTLLEMTHLIGDAYYELKRFDESVPYLEKFNKQVKTKREDDYQLAYAYYKSLNYDKAIQLYDKVAKTKDSLGQIALYHVAECYLKLGNNAYARTAFEQASVIAINEKIQEDALYNYAILSYKLDINPYDEAIEALELYLEKYPDSDRKKEVYEYLLNVFTQTNNYAKALKSLDKIEDKNIRLKSAYQIIAYNHGVELFQKTQYDQAIAAFELTNKFAIDDEISNNAKYWTSEIYFLQKKIDKAITSYKEYVATPGSALSPHRKDALYNLAYAFIQKQKLPDAIEYFRLYLQEPIPTNMDKAYKEQKADVLLRLADLYYTTKQNDLAIKYYQEALDFNYMNQDKALFFLAKTYGYKNDTENKIKQLIDIVNNYPKSKYIVVSIYEVGLSYRYKNQDGIAFKYFTQLVKDYPTSNLTKDAEIEIADIYFKEKKYTESEEMYTKILEKYESNRKTCAKALKGIVEIYKAKRTPELVDALVTKYPCAEFTMDDQEEVYYNSAIEPYLDSAFQESISELNKYLTKFPKGKYEIEIKSYLANSYYRTGKDSLAMLTYKHVLEKPTTDFTELAAIRVSKYFYNKSMYNDALPYYLKLEKLSTKPDVLYNSQIGAMRCNFLLENWADALDYSFKVLSNTQISNNIKLEAEFAKGISQFRLNKTEDAQKTLAWVIKNTTSIFAAESKYCLAEIQYNASDFAKAETEVRELLKMKPAYDYWVAKALILQTKILIAKKDLFQAEYTLKSVLDNYPNQDDGILLDANQLWDELMQVKNKPKDVKDPGTTVIEIKE